MFMASFAGNFLESRNAGVQFSLACHRCAFWLAGETSSLDQPSTGMSSWEQQRESSKTSPPAADFEGLISYASGLGLASSGERFEKPFPTLLGGLRQ